MEVIKCMSLTTGVGTNSPNIVVNSTLSDTNDIPGKFSTASLLQKWKLPTKKLSTLEFNTVGRYFFSKYRFTVAVKLKHFNTISNSQNSD